MKIDLVCSYLNLLKEFDLQWNHTEIDEHFGWAII